MLTAAAFSSIIKSGSLRLIDSRGRSRIIGDSTSPRCAVRLKDRWLEYTLAFNPALQVGEADREGRLTRAQGTL